MFYDPEFAPLKLVVRYAVGHQEREVAVLANGHSLEEHTDRLEALREPPETGESPGTTYVTWSLVGGGSVAIRLDAIIALEAPELPRPGR